MTAPFTPTITTPAQPGQLSNKRGANTGADALPISCIYSNRRGVADYAGNIRVIAQRSVVAGVPDTAPTIWDSDWVAAPPTTLTPGSVGINGMVTAVYNGRVYVAPQSATTSTPPPPNTPLWSAPVTGSSVGTWRQETSISFPGAATGGGLSSMTVAAGFLYVCDSSSNIAYAKINGDGSIGGWTVSPNKPAQPGQLVGGNVGPTAAVPNQGFLIILGGQGNVGTVAVSTNVQNVGLNADGSLQSWVSAGVALPAVRAAMGLFYNQNSGYIVVVGGNDGAGTLQTTVWHAPVTGLGVIGAWVLTDTALPLARNGVALAFNPVNNTLWALGGNNISPQTTTWFTSVGGAGAIGGAWTASVVLAFATYNAAAFIGANSNPVCVGGATNVSQAFFNNAWVQGAQTLAVGSLGVGATLVNNQDGTQTITFNYGAFGPAQTVTLNDGDQVTLTIQTVDSQNGDPSPIAITVVKIGQPPTITGIAPTGATTDGRPLLSFNYNPGAGGDLELSYQITVKNANTGLLFDSGIRYDGLNSVQSLFAPYLTSGQTYTVAVSVVSKDSPASGSSASATSTATFTPTLTAPGTPSALVATPNHAAGSIGLAWTNNVPGGATGSARLYYRRYGTTRWFLYADFATAAMAYTAMDQIALGVAYDFAVSQVDNTTHVESPLTSLVAEDFEGSLGFANQVFFKSLGTDATGNLLAWVLNGGTIAANVMTCPINTTQYCGPADLGDGTWTIRGNWVTGATGFLYVHLSPAPNNWVRVVYDGANLYLQRAVTSVVLGNSTIVPAALTNGTFYWLRVSSTGTSYTATIYADAAGVQGALINSVTWTITESALQFGFVGVGAGGGALSFGGAFAGVCSFVGTAPTGWTPNFVAGESFFNWSKSKAFAGTYSLEIFNNHSSAQGYWAGPVATFQPASYTLGGVLWGTGTPTLFGVTDGLGVYAPANTVGATDSAWHAYTNTTNLTAGTRNPLCLAYGAGTFYFDNVFINLSAATNQTITPPAGNQGYSGFLHVAGQGAAHSVALLVQQSPDDKTKLDIRTSVPFQQLLPVARYGVAHYDEIKLKIFIQDVAHLKSLQDVINTAYAGNVLYYRDGFGTLITCTPMADHAVKYIPPLFREAEVSLLQIANNFQPSIGQGSALGYLPQTLGSVAPLDSSEVIL